MNARSAALAVLLAAAAAVPPSPVPRSPTGPLARVAAATPAAPAGVRYTGVWRGGQGTGAQRVLPAQPWSEFALADKTCFDQGLRLASASATYDRRTATPLYAGVWRDGHGAQQARPAMPWQQLTAQNLAYLGQGLRLVALSIFNRNCQTAYFGAWRGEPGDAKQWLYPAMPWEDFAANDRILVSQGLRLVSIAVANVDGGLVYSGVWREGLGTDPQRVEPALEWEAFQAKDGGYAKEGLRLVAISTLALGDGRTRYAGVWRGGQGAGVQQVEPAADWAAFAAADERRLRQGLRLVAISAASDASAPGG